MLYRTRGSNTTCLQLPDYVIRIDLYNKSDGQLAGALPNVYSITYDNVNHTWSCMDRNFTTPWVFDCNLLGDSTAGTNVIQATWSDWVDPEYIPQIEIEYNEVDI